jgi:hypothetical protein
MNQKVDGRVVLIAIGAVLLVLVALWYRGGLSGKSEGRVSPQFLKLSPTGQREALETAERARRLRGAPPQPAGR